MRPIIVNIILRNKKYDVPCEHAIVDLQHLTKTGWELR